MSHATGLVRFNDGHIMYYEYSGTADIAISCLWNTYDEMWRMWRKQPNKKCGCKQDEAVRLATDYGRGFSWDGRACRMCRAITKGFGSGVEDDENETDGLPEWWATGVGVKSARK